MSIDDNYKKQIIKYKKKISMNEKDKKQIEDLNANEQFIDYILEKLLNEFKKRWTNMKRFNTSKNEEEFLVKL